MSQFVSCFTDVTGRRTACVATRGAQVHEPSSGVGGQSLQHIPYHRYCQCSTVSCCLSSVLTILIIIFLNSFEHTSRVFTSYESNMSKTCTWLYDTFNKTLRKDFDKAEDTVRRLAKTLREHREEVFSAARK